MSNPTLANFTIMGWGTGASASNVTGTQRRCQITVTAGASPISGPTITYFFPNGPYAVLPICIAYQTGGTGVISELTSNTNFDRVDFTYRDQPIAGKTYIFTLDTLGV